MRRSALLLALILLPLGARADSDAKAKSFGAQCLEVTFCNTELAGDGDCENEASDDEIVFKTGNRTTITYWPDRSTATSFTCNIFGSSNGHDHALDYKQLNQDPITADDWPMILSGPAGYLWVRCTDVVGGNVVIIGDACPLGD